MITNKSNNQDKLDSIIMKINKNISEANKVSAQQTVPNDVAVVINSQSVPQDTQNPLAWDELACTRI